MKSTGNRLCVGVAAIGLVLQAAGQPALTLVGWGVEGKDPEAFVASAAEVGFDVLIAGADDLAFLRRAVEAGERHGVRIFACLAPTGRIRARWEARHPGQPVPWQVMSPAEDAAALFLGAGGNQYLVPYQWGGEPVLTHEVLLYKILCLGHPQVRTLFEERIAEVLAVPGIEGIALDGFGYQNYRRCHCPACERRLAEFRERRPELNAAEVEVVFFRDTLVDLINGLSAHARSVRPDARTTLHIWPVFAPEPLYGNRLDVDFCGQTAAWYTLWPETKIAEYSRVITQQAKAHHARPEGVGMLGYYDKPGRFPVKDGARLELELRLMLENGCRRIQVCGAGDVIRNAGAAAVFRKIFAAGEAPPAAAGAAASIPPGPR